jgi:hypothetical protein
LSTAGDSPGTADTRRARRERSGASGVVSLAALAAILAVVGIPSPGGYICGFAALFALIAYGLGRMRARCSVGGSRPWCA